MWVPKESQPGVIHGDANLDTMGSEYQFAISYWHLVLFVKKHQNGDRRLGLTAMS